MPTGFEFRKLQDETILLGNEGVSAGTDIRPVAEANIGRCPCLNLLLRVVGTVDGADGVMEQAGNLLRISKLESADCDGVVFGPSIFLSTRSINSLLAWQ